MENIPAPLFGKRALVTGGSRGIGKAIAETLARQGCSSIAITYKGNKAAADETLAKIAEINPKIKTYAFTADVADPDCGRYAVEQALKGLETSGLDITVSNAAVLDHENFGTAETLTKEIWDDRITGLAWTPFCLARESYKVMPKGGRIIMISSGASKIANGTGIFSYAVGKATMDAVSRNLAGIFAANEVTVNSISVGATNTEALAKSVESYGPEFEKMAKGFSLFKRFGEPQEIADIVAFIASPQASWITGCYVPANGGALVPLQG